MQRSYSSVVTSVSVTCAVMRKWEKLGDWYAYYVPSLQLLQIFRASADLHNKKKRLAETVRSIKNQLSKANIENVDHKSKIKYVSVIIILFFKY